MGGLTEDANAMNVLNDRLHLACMSQNEKVGGSEKWEIQGFREFISSLGLQSPENTNSFVIIVKKASLLLNSHGKVY